MRAQSFSRFAALLFLIIAGVQAARAYLAWPVQIDTFAVPVNWSWGIAAVLLVFALLGLTARRG